MPHGNTEQKVFYFNSLDPFSSQEFGGLLRELLCSLLKPSQHLVFLCIGTDRATGDCLGPLLGQRLNSPSGSYFVYGTLEHPVHAKNLVTILDAIYLRHNNPFIIAVDASLGASEHIGYITLGVGALKPGAGVDKDLPQVGHIYITGIVNQSTGPCQMLLQTTRLQTVMHLTDRIYEGIRFCLLEGQKIPKKKRRKAGFYSIFTSHSVCEQSSCSI